MNEPHHYTFKKKFNIIKKCICGGLTVMYIVKKENFFPLKSLIEDTGELHTHPLKFFKTDI